MPRDVALVFAGAQSTEASRLIFRASRPRGPTCLLITRAGFFGVVGLGMGVM